MSIKTIAVFITGIIFSIVFTGCIVIPQTASIPLMTHKNEIQCDGGISIIPGITGTLTYAPTNKIALQVYGLRGVQVYYYHGAIGYYWKNINDLIFEIYGGYGFGYGEYSDMAKPAKLRGNHSLYFTQFNIGERSTGIDYGLGIKTGLLDSKLNNYFQHENTMYYDYSFLIEPNVFIRFGGESFKFNLKFSGLWLNKFTHINVEHDRFIPHANFNIGLSVTQMIN